jgi:hypothetical protein
MIQDQPLIVFSLAEDAVPLRNVVRTMRAADCPVSVSVDIAGEATAEQLDAPDWDTAFVRWETPELHDVYLLERDRVGVDEEADLVLAAALKAAVTIPLESAGRLIVLNHLRRTRTIYGVQVLPALVADDDHLGWSALDVALRTLAAEGDGIIFAVSEGFYDEDGEPLLAIDELSELAEIQTNEADDVADTEQ